MCTRKGTEGSNPSLSAIFGGPPKMMDGGDVILCGYDLFVAFAEVNKCFSVASNDRGVGTFSECELPGIIFTESLPLFLCATLYFSAFCCVLESNALRNVAADEFHTLL